MNRQARILPSEQYCIYASETIHLKFLHESIKYLITLLLKREFRLWFLYSSFFFLYLSHSINAGSSSQSPRKLQSASSSLYHPFAIIFARENRHGAGSSRCLRDIVPRGARPSSSINASTPLTLPQTRRRTEGVVNAVFLRLGLARDQRKRNSCNYRRIRAFPKRTAPKKPVRRWIYHRSLRFFWGSFFTDARLPIIRLCAPSFSFFLPLSQSFHQLRWRSREKWLPGGSCVKDSTGYRGPRVLTRLFWNSVRVLWSCFPSWL